LNQPVSFTSTANAAASRTNLSLGLPALTNTSNVTTMRALAGSTNTNEPYSGSVSLTNTNSLVFSNGVLLRIQPSLHVLFFVIIFFYPNWSIFFCPNSGQTVIYQKF
jgi:hypothetical protein